MDGEIYDTMSNILKKEGLENEKDFLYKFHWNYEDYSGFEFIMKIDGKYYGIVEREGIDISGILERDIYSDVDHWLNIEDLLEYDTRNINKEKLYRNGFNDTDIAMLFNDIEEFYIFDNSTKDQIIALNDISSERLLNLIETSMNKDSVDIQFQGDISDNVESTKQTHSLSDEDFSKDVYSLEQENKSLDDEIKKLNEEIEKSKKQLEQKKKLADEINQKRRQREELREKLRQLEQELNQNKVRGDREEEHKMGEINE